VSSSDVSVIVTVKNEASTIDRLLDSLAQQTLLPSEVVIVDGGSTDGTVERIESNPQRLPIKLLVRPGTNISQGRNEAICAASGEIIAGTDAGVRLVPQWLEELTRPFREDPSVAVVSGFFLPDPQTVFERAMGATVLPVEADVDPDRFLPSSRSVAFLRGLGLRLRLARRGIQISLRPGGRGLLPPALQSDILRQAVLPVRQRGWQGRPVAKAACHPLRHLSPGYPPPDRARPGPSSAVVGAAGTGRRCLPLDPVSTFTAPGGGPLAPRQSRGYPLGTHHPRVGRRGQDGGLPCRGLVENPPPAPD
jgi:hypothetical protein